MDNLLLLGVGNVAMNVARLAKDSCTIYGTTRNQEKFDQLKEAGITPIFLETNRNSFGFGKLFPIPASMVKDADVLVSFPPDANSDKALANACIGARRIIYISSTGVYGKVSGDIDENSPVDDSDQIAKNRLAAEKIWLNAGALVLRCPGLYGVESGWHLRLKNRTARIPGEGTNVASRVHLKDLARLIVACLDAQLSSSLYVVGDLEPSSHIDTLSYVCNKMNLELPPSASMHELSQTLRANRIINPRRLYEELDFKLDYPNYRAGYDAILAEYQAKSR